MLRPRIIPCLLVRNKGLVKTVKFNDYKYIGDPINAVKIFNEKLVDELIVLDIDATVEKREPDYKLIEDLAVECRMPLCYGGGVKNVDQARKILNLGVEKIATSSAAIHNPNLISEMANAIGSQSVIVVLDVKKNIFGKNHVYINNGTKKTKIDPIEFSSIAEKNGAGEIIINSIENDGMMNGYDMELIKKIRNQISLPITALGGAGSLEHVKELFNEFNVIGAAAGSLFVYKGKYKAVLINYPSIEKKNELILNKH